MKNSLARRGSTKVSKPKIIIYCEGRNTEPSYLERLKKNCNVTPVPVKGAGIGSCISFVNDVEKKWNNLSAKEKGKYSQKWMMFDYDGHKDFAEAIRLAVSKGFRVAFSNMCIEYWFLLHFEDNSGIPIPMVNGSHSQAQIDKINCYIKLYNQKIQKNKLKIKTIPLYDSNTKTIEDVFFDFLLAVDDVYKKRRIVLAFERAKGIHETKKKKGDEFSESVTTIYELLIELGVIKSKELFQGHDVHTTKKNNKTTKYYNEEDQQIEIEDFSKIEIEYQYNE